jgi:hypothetical protein
MTHDAVRFKKIAERGLAPAGAEESARCPTTHRSQSRKACLATGRPPVLVPPERARYSREHVGSDCIGWLQFQPIYDRPPRTAACQGRDSTTLPVIPL